MDCLHPYVVCLILQFMILDNSRICNKNINAAKRNLIQWIEFCKTFLCENSNIEQTRFSPNRENFVITSLKSHVRAATAVAH